MKNIEKIYEKYGFEEIFGRGEVIDVLGITKSPASELLKKMMSAEMLEPVKGMGKGKYKFKHI